ncbi:hypothetical protein KVR01_013255 [Diaporthe batatas]|uniref:uncharacterized protein n=1 Tax=Diaporthe batatas TaxID=748121 RepID=UPI001D039BCB|nr:uncharacterized protein KVR01_013255 [Diaporthe batatas]KAG8156842.1 hypothetical protein KVR01_013255 [Diaporthe batatas]
MSEGTDAARDAAHAACECGRDHRQAGNRTCEPVGLMSHLHVTVQEFLDAQEVLEFGKDGPMAPCLLGGTMEYYTFVLASFSESQTTSEKHPEWHLAAEIARLRRYFDQVAENCAEKKNGCSDQDLENRSFLPEISGNEEKTLSDAKNKVHEFWDTCYDAIEVWGILNLRRDNDPEGCLPVVDKAFKDALDAIMLLPDSENTTAQELSRQLHEILNETRRLFNFSKGRHRQ